MKSPIHILIAASEASPLARTCFMGDVVSALPVALRKLDVETSLIIPRYRSIPKKHYQELLFSGITCAIGEDLVHFDVYRTFIDSVPVYLVDQPDYFDREGIYGSDKGEYLDNGERFIFFSRAIVELLPFYPETPDLIHCNDWQTGLTPLYLKLFKETQPGYANVQTLFTLHNLANQGLFWRFDMHLTGLPWEYFTPEGIEFYGDLNLLKAGILYSDAINTVSPTYCREIQTEAFGCGLDGVLRPIGEKLHGILNGVDYDLWSPDNNPNIASPYSAACLDGKLICRESLLKSAQLNLDHERPLISMIAPLFSRKGVDLLEQSLEMMISSGCNVILQGEGDKNYRKTFSQLAEKYAGAFAFFNNFDKTIAQIVLSGSDMLLKPSRFEPCGLIQLYALRFGTIPIAHRTGGLDDSIKDAFDNGCDNQTGFKFDRYCPESMLEAVQRALVAYSDNEKWSRLMVNAMQQDFSWHQAALKYSKLYQRILTSDFTNEIN